MQQSMINSRIESENNSNANNINKNKRLNRNSSVHEVPNATKGNLVSASYQSIIIWD